MTADTVAKTAIYSWAGKRATTLVYRQVITLIVLLHVKSSVIY